MKFRLVGPFRGGRSTAVAGVRGQQRTFYMGTTGGGVWKTTDGGISWRNVSDKLREEKPQPPPAVMGEVDAQSAVGELLPTMSPRRAVPALPVDINRTIEELLETTPFDVVHVHEVHGTPLTPPIH